MVEPVEGERQPQESRRVTHKPREVDRGSVAPESWGRRALIVVVWSLAAFLLGAVLTGKGDARRAAQNVRSRRQPPYTFRLVGIVLLFR